MCPKLSVPCQLLSSVLEVLSFFFKCLLWAESCVKNMKEKCFQTGCCF